MRQIRQRALRQRDEASELCASFFDDANAMREDAREHADDNAMMSAFIASDRHEQRPLCFCR